MSTIRIRISGDRETQADLRRMTRMAPDEVGRMIHETAYVVEREAKIRCPVDTGRLRSSISTVYRAAELTAYVGTNVEYAPYVEFGTRRQRAQPYLTPAAELGRRELRRRVAAMARRLLG